MDKNLENKLSPPPVTGEVLMSFPDAIKEVIKGKKITKLSWNNTDSYGLVKDGWLMIFIDGAFKRWLVNDGDLEGVDWVVMNKVN